MSVSTYHKVTHQEADAVVFLPFATRHVFTHADLDGTNAIAFPVEAGATVLGVSLKTTTAFDNAADATVGDASDPDGYLTAAVLTPTTVNDFSFSLGGAGAFAQGKYYAATNRIIVAFTVNPAAGAAELMIYYAGKEA